MILIAGGGTGGHVYPALAIADALVERGIDDDDVHFVGSSRGLEARVVPAAGYTITLLPGRGIRRDLSLHAVVANLGAVAGLAIASLRAIVLVVRARPDAVVCVGGYAAAPAALAAVLVRRPVVVAESNAVPGAVNRLVARWARHNAVAWPGTPLPGAVVTGNPVRPEIVAVDRSPDGRKAARAASGNSDDRRLVVAFGGSLGARSINRAVEQLATSWTDRGDVTIHHIVGRRDWSSDGEAEAVPGQLWYRRFAYEEHMEHLYAGADVLICRSGATTSAEIAVAGVASVLVPLPGAPGDHQTANARALEAAGAAVVVPDGECTGNRLGEVIDPLLADESRLESMSTAAKALGRPDAAHRVAGLVLDDM